MKENFFESHRRIARGVLLEFSVPVALMLIALLVCGVVSLVLMLIR